MSMARTPDRAATAFGSSPDDTRSTSHPSRRLTASVTEVSVESVSSRESLKSRSLGALHRQIALDRGGQRRQIERLLDVIISADLQRLALVLPFVERGHHHHAHRAAERWMLFHDAANLPTVASRHHDVEQHESAPNRLEQRERFVPVV